MYNCLQDRRNVYMYMKYSSSWARAFAGVDEAWQQRQERMNRSLKEMREKFIRRSPVDLLSEVERLVKLQLRHEEAALYVDGPYKLKKEFQIFFIDKTTWETLSRIVQRRHLSDFRRASGERRPNPFRPNRDRQGRKRNSSRLGRLTRKVSFCPQPDVKEF